MKKHITVLLMVFGSFSVFGQSVQPFSLSGSQTNTVNQPALSGLISTRPSGGATGQAKWGGLAPAGQTPTYTIPATPASAEAGKTDKPEGKKRPNWFTRNCKAAWNTFVAPSSAGTVRTFRSPYGGNNIVIATSASERVYKNESEGVSQSFYGGVNYNRSSSYSYEKRSDPVIGVPNYVAPREYIRFRTYSSSGSPSQQDLTPARERIPAGTKIIRFGR
jgi:hypothetical protein